VSCHPVDIHGPVAWDSSEFEVSLSEAESGASRTPPPV